MDTLFKKRGQQQVSDPTHSYRDHLTQYQPNLQIQKNRLINLKKQETESITNMDTLQKDQILRSLRLLFTNKRELSYNSIIFDQSQIEMLIKCRQLFAKQNTFQFKLVHSSTYIPDTICNVDISKSTKADIVNQFNTELLLHFMFYQCLKYKFMIASRAQSNQYYVVFQDVAVEKYLSLMGLQAFMTNQSFSRLYTNTNCSIQVIISPLGFLFDPVTGICLLKPWVQSLIEKQLNKILTLNSAYSPQKMIMFSALASLFEFFKGNAYQLEHFKIESWISSIIIMPLSQQIQANYGICSQTCFSYLQSIFCHDQKFYSSAEQFCITIFRLQKWVTPNVPKFKKSDIKKTNYFELRQIENTTYQGITERQFDYYTSPTCLTAYNEAVQELEQKRQLLVNTNDVNEIMKFDQGYAESLRNTYQQKLLLYHQNKQINTELDRQTMKYKISFQRLISQRGWLIMSDLKQVILTFTESKNTNSTNNYEKYSTSILNNFSDNSATFLDFFFKNSEIDLSTQLVIVTFIMTTSNTSYQLTTELSHVAELVHLLKWMEWVESNNRRIRSKNQQKQMQQNKQIINEESQQSDAQIGQQHIQLSYTTTVPECYRSVRVLKQRTTLSQLTRAIIECNPTQLDINTIQDWNTKLITQFIQPFKQEIADGSASSLKHSLRCRQSDQWITKADQDKIYNKPNTPLYQLLQTMVDYNFVQPDYTQDSENATLFYIPCVLLDFSKYQNHDDIKRVSCQQIITKTTFDKLLKQEKSMFETLKAAKQKVTNVNQSFRGGVCNCVYETIEENEYQLIYDLYSAKNKKQRDEIDKRYQEQQKLRSNQNPNLVKQQDEIQSLFQPGNSPKLILIQTDSDQFNWLLDQLLLKAAQVKCKQLFMLNSELHVYQQKKSGEDQLFVSQGISTVSNTMPRIVIIPNIAKSVQQIVNQLHSFNYYLNDPLTFNQNNYTYLTTRFKDLSLSVYDGLSDATYSQFYLKPDLFPGIINKDDSSVIKFRTIYQTGAQWAEHCFDCDMLLEQQFYVRNDEDQLVPYQQRSHQLSDDNNCKFAFKRDAQGQLVGSANEFGSQDGIDEDSVDDYKISNPISSDEEDGQSQQSQGQQNQLNPQIKNQLQSMINTTSQAQKQDISMYEQTKKAPKTSEQSSGQEENQQTQSTQQQQIQEESIEVQKKRGRPNTKTKLQMNIQK